MFEIKHYFIVDFGVDYTYLSMNADPIAEYELILRVATGIVLCILHVRETFFHEGY